MSAKRSMTFVRAVATTLALAPIALGCAGMRPSDPDPTSTQGLRIVFMTDVHAALEPRIVHALAACAQAINREQPDLVVAGGDLVASGVEHDETEARPYWDAYTEFLSKIEAPVVHALGNHDLVGPRPNAGGEPADPRRVFRRRLSADGTWQVVDVRGYRLLLLDSIALSSDPEGYRGHVSQEQLSWLRNAVERAPRDARLIVVTHMPLVTALFAATQGGEHPVPPSRLVGNGPDVLRAFGDRRPLLILQGHLHVLETIWWRGTLFLTGGAVSGRWWNGAVYDSGPGFVVLDLVGDRIDWRYVEYAPERSSP